MRTQFISEMRAPLASNAWLNGPAERSIIFDQPVDQRFEQARRKLEKAIALQPTNPYAYYYMARARFIQSESGQALALLAKAELSFGDDSSWLTWVFLLRGQIDETLSRPEDARKQYEAALAADPRNQEARDRIRRLDEFPDR